MSFIIPSGDLVRIAAISDIHSNIYALEAVIDDIKARAVDITVNLGDILYGSIAPKATYELLMEHGFTTISGNQDREIYEATPSEIEANPTLKFIHDELEVEALDWLKNLPFDHQLTDEVYLCHGTPSSDLIYLLENVESGLAQVRDDDEIIALLSGQVSDVVVCGHTHTARVVGTSSNQLIVNAGSVGLPAYRDEEPFPHAMQSFSPHATYTIIEQSAHGWNVQHTRVAYDYQEAAKASSKVTGHNWAQYLTTGRSAN